MKISIPALAVMMTISSTYLQAHDGSGTLWSGLEINSASTVEFSIDSLKDATSSSFEKNGNQSYSYAQEDAATYVASGEDIRGVQFERAVRAFRSSPGDTSMSDFEFASAIIADMWRGHAPPMY